MHKHLEQIKNRIGSDCWNIIIDYLVGTKQYNKNKFNLVIKDLNECFIKDDFNWYFYLFDQYEDYCYLCHRIGASHIRTIKGESEAICKKCYNIPYMLCD